MNIFVTDHYVNSVVFVAEFKGLLFWMVVALLEVFCCDIQNNFCRRSFCSKLLFQSVADCHNVTAGHELFCVADHKKATIVLFCHWAGWDTCIISVADLNAMLPYHLFKINSATQLKDILFYDCDLLAQT